MDEPTSVLTVEEAARYLRVSRGKAYQMAQSGQIPSVRFGRSIRVPKGALDRWVEQETRGSAA